MSKKSELQPEKKLNRDDLFDTTGLLLDYLGNWQWFVLAVIICLVGAFFYIKTLIPVWDVSASAYLNNEANKTSETLQMSGAQGASPLAKQFIDESEIEVLKSRNNLIKIVDSLKLAYSYYESNQFRDIPVYRSNGVEARLDSVSLINLTSPIIVNIEATRNGHFDIEGRTWYNGVEETRRLHDVKLPATLNMSQGVVKLHRSPTVHRLARPLKIVISNPRQVAGRVASSLDIKFADNSTTILRINCNSDIPAQGADIIDCLIDFYNKDIIAEKNRSAIQTEAFIIDRLAMIYDELRGVEDRLQAYRQANNITDLQAQSQLNLTQQNEAEGQVSEIDAQLSIINSIENTVTRTNGYELVPAITGDGTLTAVIENYNSKVNRLNDRKNLGVAEDELVGQMQEDLSREKSRMLDNIRTYRNTLSARRRSVASIGGRSSGQLATVPQVDKGLQEIFREQSVKSNIYTFLLQKREEIALQKTMAVATARLIDNPTPSGPVWPRSGAIYLVAFLLGLVIPALLILFKRLAFPVFKDQEDMERFTAVPVLGEMSRIKDNESKVVMTENSTTPASELFRLLRNNLQFVMTSPDQKVVMVSSAVSGEGKTFITTNLSLAFAMRGKKVCVVGMDIRRPVLAREFKLNNDLGATTFLSGQVTDIHDICFPSGLNDHLFVIPAGPIPPNPNELLLSDNMDRFFEQLRQEFDYVFVDSAPIGIVSDTYLIAPHTDVQVFVARANYSTKRCLRFLHQAIESDRFPHCYLVVNSVNMTSNAYSYRRYGSYGSYGKYGSYGHYSTSHDKPSPWNAFRRIFKRARRRNRK